MIEKMKYLNITGPKSDIDRMVNTYLSRYEIHLENALTELTDVKSLSPYVEGNPYRAPLSTIKSICSEMTDTRKTSSDSLNAAQAIELVNQFKKELDDIDTELEALRNQHNEIIEPLKIIRPFRNFDYDITSIKNFRHISYQFGRIDKQSFQKFQKYIYHNIDTLFVKAEEDELYIYGIYFAPKHQADKIKAVYSSMHFEPISLTHTYTGTAKDACDNLETLHRQIHADIDAVKEKRQKYLTDHTEQMLHVLDVLQTASDNFEIRKLAACTPEDGEVFYILCGWMSEADARGFEEAIKNDSKVYCISSEDKNTDVKRPPTKLKNPKLFKPFELFIRMYGIPAYGEMDPTWLLAITYSFIFGAMFGDVGQGLLLAIGGAILYRTRKMDLAGIISCAGVFSTIFGFLYGSLFGFEDILPALWLRPMNKIMSVPFIGKLNAVFVIAVVFGMFLILLCMILNIINAHRSGDVEKKWFDSNAVAGFVFYGTIVLSVVLIITGHKLPSTILIVIMLVVPLIIMFLKEPLTNLVEKKAQIFPEQKGVFFVQSFFELFEVLLSYLSNTLSFLRVGAFAVSHAAMMEVVLMLAGAENGGSPNWIVIIIGNLFVCAMEGLIVGIQVLRLEYYEIFSRFYKGSGREFRPFKSKSASK